MCSLNWAAVGAIAGCIYTIAFIVSVLFLVRQLRAQSFSEVYERLQTEDVRQARATLYELDEKKMGFDQWHNDDTSLVAVEKVCQRYDYFAKMVRGKFLPKKLVLRSWAWQVDRLWRVARPFIQSRRTIQGQGRLWEDFQWLAQQSTTWLSKRGSADILKID
jgi:hypothetical protein